MREATGNNDEEEILPQQKLSLVVTGFGPFGKVTENPTTILIHEFPNYLTSSDVQWKQELLSCIDEWIILETSAKGVNDKLDTMIMSSSSTTTNRIFLHLGVDARGTGFKLEQCAYNEATFRIPDQQGYQPQQESIFSDEALGQRLENRTLNLEELMANMSLLLPDTTVETKVSTDPGRFVCNYLYCKSLKQQQYCLFVHIPPLEVISKEMQLEYLAHLMQQLVSNPSIVLAQTKATTDE
jgi:pyroglutamyl-peptidase